MITVKDFKKILDSCPDNWKLFFKKYEHMDKIHPEWGYRGMPNRTSVEVIDISSRMKDEDGHHIYKFIMSENDDIDGLPKDFFLTTFINGKDELDILDFRLEVQVNPGHFNYYNLEVSEGDKGYSDQVMYIELDEKD